MSWVGTAGAILTCLLIFAALTVTITEKRFALFPTRFMLNKSDAYPVVKATAIKLATAPHPKQKYRVILIGDSAIREAITNMSDLRQRVAKAAGRPVEITSLVAGGLTQLDAVDLCGMLRGHVRGQILLEISPFLMAKGEDQNTFDRTLDRMGLDSTDLSGEFDTAGYARPLWSKNFFLRNIRFMLSRTDAVFNVVHPFPLPAEHFAERTVYATPAELRRDMPRVYRLTKDIHRRAPQRAAVYQRMIQRLKEAGIHVTLIEAPFNPEFLTPDTAKEGLPAWIISEYDHARRALMRRAHVGAWDFNAQCDFNSRDFRDPFHIDRLPARERFTQALAEHIAASVTAKPSATTGATTQTTTQATTQKASLE